MYIKKIEITNVRAIDRFVMEFAEGEEPGWHVLLGENGTGKSTIARSISAVLIGPEDIGHVRPNWDEWLKIGEESGTIELLMSFNDQWDKTAQTRPPADRTFTCQFTFLSNGRVKLETNASAKTRNPLKYSWSGNKGWFSAGYGPFRRLSGGDPIELRPFYSAPRAGAHLSMFGESVALTEALVWLKDLDRRRLKENEMNGWLTEADMDSGDAGKTLSLIRQFINTAGLLPFGALFQNINADGEPVFKDGFGNDIKIGQLSDGYRSVLSMVFELLRQLFLQYSLDRVFEISSSDNKISMVVSAPGVVIIDEVDVHLHPTWQSEIGQWFRQNFPNIQFIVTTHSPLICRAAERGSIWKLANPGGKERAHKLSKIDKDKLVYGDILDAYDTDAFGDDIERGKEGRSKLERYRKLTYKFRYGQKMTQIESRELAYLKTLFVSNAEN
ncbi:AAA family ATPase [Flaviaesturariibacter aridisoli]|uniref:ATPase AAA-type core domain-containing protein n=1 Tax=Flaviaesturariibacter aridisoli TaxID=2545761 RepID=A0A4R4DXM3_9BACT|nr:AAA family ATPase [Flaviaesturariibacter aridisoli]TCZ67501.1 hypothetical protein E0486_15590 [Flaviaesturariibacter aridisoli]